MKRDEQSVSGGREGTGARAVDALVSTIRDRTATVGVIGLGYVGLPLCLALSEAGLRTLGFDINPNKVARISAGESYLRHIEQERIRRSVGAETFSATTDMSRLSEPDVLMICVPTPLKSNREPNLEYVVSTTAYIARTLRRGQLVVLMSTTYPGTTREIVRPQLEKGGLRVGEDIWLAFAPEREDPGNAEFPSTQIPRIIGADDRDSEAAAIAVFETVSTQVQPVSSTAAAEAVKLTENIFRSVNVALVNELKIIYSAMGIDVWEVIEGAKTKPFGFMPFYPGPGLGGHCIPIDPFYLAWKAREFDERARIVELAGEINSNMPAYVIDELIRALERTSEKGLSGARVLVVGLAYKRNIEDIRESPSLRLMELVEARGGVADYYDPYIPTIPAVLEGCAMNGRKSVAWDLDVIAGYDAVLIATDHDVVDYTSLARSAQLVVDTRNACARAGAELTRVILA